MIKKIVIGFCVVFIALMFGLSGYKKYFEKSEPKEVQVDVFKTAMKKIDVEYLPYGDNNSDCLLFVKNNNKFQVNISGTITKEDENGVHDEDHDDELNINLNPKQTYVIETTNPNNREARQNREAIHFNSSDLKAKPVEGSDKSGKKSTQLLLQDHVEVSLSLDKKNDQGQPLISITNHLKKKVLLNGYVIFYQDAGKKTIDTIAELSYEDLPKQNTYKDYLYIGSISDEASSYYDIFINMCE